MHEKAPAALTRGLSAAQAGDVTNWWRRLAAADRDALRFPRDTLRIVGRFASPDEPDEPADDFDRDLYEHIVNHEQAFIERHPFHICTAHAAAREAVTRGRIPAGFRCPNARAECPMRVLLDASPGHDVKLAMASPTSARCR